MESNLLYSKTPNQTSFISPINSNLNTNNRSLKFASQVYKENPTSRTKTVNFSSKRPEDTSPPSFLDRRSPDQETLKFSTSRIPSRPQKSEALEQEILKLDSEKKSLQTKNESLEKELSEAREKISFLEATLASSASQAAELRALKFKFNEVSKNNEILKNDLDLSIKKQGFTQEELEKKELLLQTYENKIAELQNEVKNLNESLSEKENYIFELRSQKPVKRENRKIEKAENHETETRMAIRMKEQNDEIERLMTTIREMSIREKKWEETLRVLRNKELEMARLVEENKNYENIVRNLRREISKKNEEIARMQFSEETSIEERIKSNRFHIEELKRKLKDSEVENANLSRIVWNSQKSSPSYTNSYGGTY